MPSPSIFPVFKFHFEHCIFHEDFPLDATTLFLNLCDTLCLSYGLDPTLPGSQPQVAWISPGSSDRCTDTHFFPTLQAL